MNTDAQKYQLSDSGIFWGMLVITLLVVVFFILNLLLGSVSIPIAAVLDILSGTVSENPSWNVIVLQTRLPQALTAVLAGSALGASGLMMQTLFRNPLAGPSVLGVSAGASLGVAVVMLFIAVPGGSMVAVSQVTGNFSVVVAAFAGALAVLLLIGVLAVRFRSNTVVLLQFYSLKEDLQAFVIWGLGSFGNVSMQQMYIFLPVIIAGLLLAGAMIKPMNLLLLGDHYAANLGLKTESAKGISKSRADHGHRDFDCHSYGLLRPDRISGTCRSAPHPQSVPNL